MAYPPQLPPATRTDSTLAASQHASDHNKTSLALAAIIAVLGADPAAGYSDVTARMAAILTDVQTIVDGLGDDIDARVPPAVVEALATDPTIRDAGLEAVENAAAVLNVVLGDDPRLNKLLDGLAELGFLVEVDDFNRVSRYVDVLGRTWVKLAPEVDLPGDQLLPGTVTVDKLDPDVADAIAQPFPNDVLYSYAIVDEGYKVAIGIRQDGTVDARVNLLPGTVTEDMLDPTLLEELRTPTSQAALQITGTTPNRSLWLYTPAGDRILIDNTRDPYDPFLMVADVVSYDTTTAGRRWATYRRGFVEEGGPMLPNRDALIPIGDSLTAANAWQTRAASNLGISSIRNTAVGGHASADIAVLFGAIDPVLTLDGNTVPDSGSVAVTGILPETGWRYGHTPPAVYVWPGYLETPAGKINGELRRDYQTPTGVLTFVRTTPGNAVALNGPAVFHCTSKDAEVDRDGIAVVFLGRNNGTSAQAAIDVPAQERAIVNRLASYGKSFLVLSVINGGGETSGTSAYNGVIAINQAKAAEFGDSYYDVRRDFIDEGLDRAGITPTSADNVAIANDTPPPSLMSGPTDVHPNSTGYQVLGDLIAERITARSYLA